MCIIFDRRIPIDKLVAYCRFFAVPDLAFAGYCTWCSVNENGTLKTVLLSLSICYYIEAIVILAIVNSSTIMTISPRLVRTPKQPSVSSTHLIHLYI